MDDILKFLTGREITIIKTRQKIASLIKQGLTVRQIVRQLKVGSDTVVRVRKLLKEPTAEASNKDKTRELRKNEENERRWSYGLGLES